MMASRLNLPTSEHSYDDAFLYQDALKAKIIPTFEVQAVCALFDVNMHQLKVWLDKFKQYDLNRDGTIDRAEFDLVMQSARLPCRAGRWWFARGNIDQLFDFFDTNGTGTMDYREFVQGLALLSGRCSQENRITIAFLVLDFEGSGRISVNVLQKVLSSGAVRAGFRASCRIMRRAASHALDVPLVSNLPELQGLQELDFPQFRQLAERYPGMLQPLMRHISGGVTGDVPCSDDLGVVAPTDSFGNRLAVTFAA